MLFKYAAGVIRNSSYRGFLMAELAAYLSRRCLGLLAFMSPLVAIPFLLVRFPVLIRGLFSPPWRAWPGMPHRPLQ